MSNATVCPIKMSLKTGIEKEIAVTESWELPEFWE
jgi:hypothetical protein